MAKRLITAVDLYCGGGGTTTGLELACEVLGYDLDCLGINHWDVAIETYKANHPHLQEPKLADINFVKPREVVPSGRLDLLWASIECTHFSIARGGKPVSDQKRSSANKLLDWLDDLYVETLIIENVREFLSWGPIGADGRPLKSKKGEMFRAFIVSLKARGYRVEWKILNAADFQAVTTRERLFIQARRGRKPIVWATPTHSKSGENTLFRSEVRKWRAAREIIDWGIPGKSIFARKKPLAASTMARIITGLEKFGGPAMEPFLVILRKHGSAQSVDAPIPTVTAGGNHVALAQPFILAHRQFDEDCVDSIQRPLRTITAKGGSDFALVEPKPFIVPQFSQANPKSVDGPVGAITTTSRGMGLVEPKAFVVGAGGPQYAGKPRSVDQPLSTVLTNEHRALVHPFVMKVTHTKSTGDGPVRSAEAPLSTITTAKGGEHAVVSPFLLQLTHGGRIGDLEDPLPTVTCAHRGETGIVNPYLMKYCSTGGARSVEEPMDTLTTKPRYGLVTPLVAEIDGQMMALDIHFRMLTPRELARAMSFPDSYEFKGNREAVVRQIGNAVDVSMAKALCEAVLSS